MSTQNILTPLKDWYQSRESRERILIMLMCFLAAGILIHLAIWTPLVNTYTDTESELKKMRKDVAWMRTAVPKIISLKGVLPVSKVPSAGSLQTIVNQTSRAAKMQNVIRRVKPTKNGRIKIWIEKAKFKNLITWLETIHQQHGIRIYQIGIDRDSSMPGHINARVVFVR